MKARVFPVLLFFGLVIVLSTRVWALDEAVLTPTPERAGAMTQKDSE